MSKTNLTSAGHTLWSKMPKANAELFALTYGSLVTELIRDYDNDIPEINTQLERIGRSIGIRCVDELLSKAEVSGTGGSAIHIPTCRDIKDTAEVVAKVGFRMFLGMSCEVGEFSADGRAFSLFLYENPLSIFVELPESASRKGRAAGTATAAADEESLSSAGDNLGGDGDEYGPDWSQIKYSNVYCGVIRGALEQVSMKVECDFVKDVLKGDEVNEIRVQLKEIMLDGAGDDYKEE